MRCRLIPSTSNSVISIPKESSPMPRRKYLFGSRQEAEDKVKEIDRMAHQQLRLARALYTGGVQWVKNPHRGPYRMGAFDLKSPGGPRIVLVFAPAGQEPDLKVYDFDGKDYTEWKNWFFTKYHRADDKEAASLAYAIQAVEKIIGRALKEGQ